MPSDDTTPAAAPASTGVFHGRLSDGASAASRPVEIRLRSQGLDVRALHQDQSTIWPWSSLTAATPLTKGADHALLQSTAAPDASLLVTGSDFVTAISISAPQLTAHAFGWRATRPMLVALAGLAVLAGGLWLGHISPARGIAMVIPESLRRQAGSRAIDAMTEGRATCNAAAGREALERLITRLSNGTDENRRFNVRVINWNLINAFAAPGGQIVLTSGVIAASQSADELAGILAHEMGHAEALHPETAIIRTVGLYAAFELMTGGGGGTLSSVGVLLSQLRYSKAAERDADDRATRRLEHAKISPSGLANFFRRLDARERQKKGSKHWDILNTHPKSRERAEAVAKHHVADGTPALDPADWQALRSICIASPKPTPKANGG
ncbi:MAG: M48 family metallopeptidase [Hyphomicrobiaceae bacterium]